MAVSSRSSTVTVCRSQPCNRHTRVAALRFRSRIVATVDGEAIRRVAEPHEANRTKTRKSIVTRDDANFNLNP